MKAEEIKFKGIRVHNGEWVYGDLVHYFFIKNGKRTDYVSIGIDLDFYDVIPETVCQFTTLKDKNGVEIYRDDKFQYHEHEGFILPDLTGEILFRNGCFGYVPTSENMGEAFRSFSEIDELKKDFLDHIEVVGNIHDKAQQIVRRSISLWVEGFAVTGERQGASMIGTYEAADLDDAVKQYMETHKGDVDWDRFGRGRHAIWACEIFDNEEEARKSFG